MRIHLLGSVTLQAVDCSGVNHARPGAGELTPRFPECQDEDVTDTRQLNMTTLVGFSNGTGALCGRLFTVPCMWQTVAFLVSSRTAISGTLSM